MRRTDKFEAGASALAYKIPGLDYGATYEVQVAAKNPAGAGAYAATRALVRTGVCDRTPLVRDFIVVKSRTDLYSSSTRIPLANSPCATITPEHLRAITEMNLAFGPIGTLTENAFSGMDNLRKLYLNAAIPKLTALPENVFAGLSKLRELRLQGNEFSSLPAGVFAELSELRQLTLQNNQLTALPANVLAGLADLRFLSLASNQLTTLPANAFAEAVNLRVLKLENNSLNAFPPGVFNGVLPGEFKVSGINTVAAPANFRLRVRDGGLRAEWDEVENAHYQLRWKPAAAATFAPGDSHALRDTAHTISGLTNGVEYRVYVAAVPQTPSNTNSARENVWPFADAKAAPFPPPGAPQNVRVNPVSKSLSVVWSAPNDDGGKPIAKYRVRWKPLAATTFAPADRAEVAAPELRYDISGLTNGATYEVQVAAETSAGLGAYSGAVRGMPRTVPGAPQSVAIAAGDSKLRITWQLPESDGGAPVTSFLLRWKLKSASQFALKDAVETSADVFVYTIAGLQSGAEYEVQISAQNAAGISQEVGVEGVPFAAPGAPRSLAITPENEQLRVVWQPPADDGGSPVTGYEVLWDPPNAGGDKRVSLAASAAEHTITGLTNGVTYTVQVRAFVDGLDGAAVRGESAAAQSVPRTVPNAPQSLAIAAGDGALKVSWQLPASDGGAAVTSFRLRWKSAEDDNFAAENAAELSANVFAHEISGLQNGAQYDVEVAAKNVVGFGAAAAAQSVPFTAPDAPQSLALVPEDEKIRAEWRPPAFNGGSPITGYEVRWDPPNAGGAKLAITGPLSATYTIPRLANGTTYTVKVRAFVAGTDGVVAGEYAVARSAPLNAPGAPQSPAVEERNRELRITWQPPANNGGAAVTAYHFRWRPQTGAYASATVPADATSYTLQNLQNGAVYEVHIAAENRAGVGAYTEALRGTPFTEAGAPLSVMAVVGDRQLRIDWKKPVSDGGLPLAGYTVSWSPANEGGANRAEVAATATTYTILRLRNGATYTARVRAFAEKDGERILGLEARAFSATPNTLPGAPQSPALEAGDQQLRVTWTAPADNGGAAVRAYHLRWKSPADAAYATDNIAAGSTTYTIRGLRNGGTYEVQIAAENRAGLSPYTDALFGVPYARPGPPQSVAVTPGDKQLRIDWKQPDSDGGFPVIGYRVSWQPPDGYGLTSTTPAGASNTTYTLNRLTNGTTYHVRVETLVIKDGGPLFSEVVAAPPAVPHTVPDAPQSLAITPGDSELKVAWKMPASDGGAPVTTYRLRWNPADASDFAGSEVRLISASGGDDFAQTISGLTNGAAYSVEVTAKNRAGFGAPELARSKPRTVPGAPAELAVAPQDAKLVVTWQAPRDDGGAAVTAYHVRWKAAAAATYEAAEIAPSPAGPTHTITGLTNGTNYQVQVAAENEAGESAAAAGAAVPRKKPCKPEIVSAQASNTKLSITVKWEQPDCNDGSGITGYRHRLAAEGGAWQPEKETGGASARMHTIESGEGLTSGIVYRVQIAAVNQAGASGWSDAASGTPWLFDLDVDGDGEFKSEDAVLIDRFLRGGALEFDETKDVNSAVAAAAEKLTAAKNSDQKKLDMDGDGKQIAADGVLLVRWLLGLRGADLITGVLPFGVNADEIEKTIAALAPDLDVNGDGRITAADGIIVARYLLGVTGPKLVAGQTQKGDRPYSRQVRAKIGRGVNGMALDVDGNGAVTGDDSTMIWRYSQGWHMPVANNPEIVSPEELVRGYDLTKGPRVLEAIEALLPPPQ